MLTKFCAARSLGNIPVEQPIKFDLVIKLTTAKDARPDDRNKMLGFADEVIEETP